MSPLESQYHGMNDHDLLVTLAVKLDSHIVQHDTDKAERTRQLEMAKDTQERRCDDHGKRIQSLENTKLIGHGIVLTVSAAAAYLSSWWMKHR